MDQQSAARAETGGNVFRSRNFRLVFFGALVSELGAVLYSFAVGFYILDISGNNAFLQGLYLALSGAALLLFTPIGGVLGDRFHKAKIMVICDFLKGSLILLATPLMLFFSAWKAHIAILFVIGVLGNAVSGIFNPASGSLLPSIVREDQLQQANAYFSVKSAAQSILGVVLAGVLYAAMPITLLFTVVGVCYLFSGVSEIFIRYGHTPKKEKMTIRLALSDLRDGLFYLKTQKALLAIMFASLFINFFLTPIGSNFIPYFVKTDVAGTPGYLFSGFLTPELWSSVFSVLIGASSLIGAILLSSRKADEKCGMKVARRLSAVSLFMIVLSVAYLVLISRHAALNVFLILFCAGCFAMGFYFVFINIPINTAIMRIVDKNMLSKVTSIISILSQGLTPISAVFAGAVLQVAGSAALLFVCAAGFTATALALLFNPHTKEI